jgi:hypothetical protein
MAGLRGPPGGVGAKGLGVPTINVKSSTAGPRGPPGAAGAEGLGEPTINVKNVNDRPPKAVRARDPGVQCSTCVAGPSDRAVNGCRNLGINTQRVVRTHFTLTQVGHFYRCFSWGQDMTCAPLSGVGKSSHLSTHVLNSKTRLRRSDPPLTVREAPREPTRSTDT